MSNILAPIASNKGYYKLSLQLNGQPIMERVFDIYNKININFSKEEATSFIHAFKEVLASYDSRLDFELNNYDLLDDYQWKVSKDRPGKQDNKLLKNQSQGDTSKGYYVNEQEKFRYIFSLNDNTIIERNFFVKNYNPNARFSVNLLEVFNRISEDFAYKVKELDKLVQWNEFEISEAFGFTPEKVKAMTSEERSAFLRQINYKKESLAQAVNKLESATV